MSAAAIQVEDLSVTTAEGTQIVAGVRLTVGSGELFGLVGETGAGKTLTARAILGLLPQGLYATGQVLFGDGEWITLDKPLRVARHLGRSTGLLLQNPVSAFDPLQRIGPQLIEAVVKNGVMSRIEAGERAASLCQQLGLGDVESIFRLYPHELSGGMSQRLALAVTLMPEPQFLVVDEPTSALDANLRVDALRLLRSISRENGTGMLLISHDLGLVSHFCDTIAVLYAGHIVDVGPTLDVLRLPAHPYTRTLVSCSLSLDDPRRDHLPALGGEPPQPGLWPSGCYFHPRCPDAQDRCRVERPVLTKDGTRRVACHFPLNLEGM